MNNEIKSKVLFSVLFVLGMVLLVGGSTYAIFTWSSDNIKYSGSSECFTVFYAKGEDIGNNEEKATLTPSYDYTGGLSSTVKFNFSSECNMTATGKLYIDTLDTTSTNLYEEGVLNYQVLKNGTVTDLKGNITSSGTTEINLGVLGINTSATDEYKVYVWLDYNKIKNEHATSSYFGKIRAEASQIGE